MLKVGNLQMTQADFEATLKTLEEAQGVEGGSELPHRKIGEKLATLFMLAELAKQNHLESSPQVLRQLDLDRNQILSNAEYDKLKVESAPTPEQVSAYYSAHLDDYDVMDLRRVFIWSTKDGHGLSPEQAKTLAAEVRSALQQGKDVSKLLEAKHFKPGEIVFDNPPLPFQRGELPGHLNDKAFALKEGEWTELNDAPGTYVFVQAVKRSRKDLKDVSSQIQKKLQAENLREQLEELKKKNGLWLDESYFGPPKSAASQSTASVESKPETKEEKDEKPQQ